MKSDYSDIIHLPHHVSKTHPQMSMHDRAVNPAQPDVTAPPAQALKPLDGELQPPAVPASAQHFSYEIRLSSQRQLTWAKGSIQTPDGILSVSWELLENGEKQVEWSLAPAGEDKVPTM